MSYFLDTYGTPLMFFGGLIVLAALLLVYGATAVLLARRLALKSKAASVLVGVAVFGAALSMYLLMLYVPDYLNDGRIRRIYIVRQDDAVRLAVWFVREDTPAGMTRVYSHRIKSFDMKTGERCGRVTLARRYPYDDYTVFGPFDQYAWGHAGQSGIALLDLFEARVAADEAAILQRNPVLGHQIQLTRGPHGKRFDPITFGLYVYTAAGDIFRIDPDLKAKNVRSLKLGNRKHDPAACAVCRHDAQFIDLAEASAGWGYGDAAENMLTYRNAAGQTLNSFRLNDIFDDDRAIYAVARVQGEIWLFATMQRYRLAAIRTAADTGRIIGVINYF